jgi:peptidoglycan hydrolase-like protein with peptidoglycan-binding domain
MKERALQVLSIVCACAILLASTADCFAAKAAPNNQVKAVQTALKNEGYKVEVDGKMGKNTRAALMQFQKAKKLPTTGKADKATLKKLGIN